MMMMMMTTMSRPLTSGKFILRPGDYTEFFSFIGAFETLGSAY
jgi:hypothetical protein